MNQDDVRQLAHRHDVSDEQYATALLTVLSQRLTEKLPTTSILTPGLLVGIAVVLLLVGMISILFLGGEFAAIGGWALIALAIGVAFWSRQKARAAKR